jgi:hypothetical protein
MDPRNKSIFNLCPSEVLQECGRTLNEADHHQHQSASQAQGCSNLLISHLDQLEQVKIQAKNDILYRVNSRKLQVIMVSRKHLNEDLWHLIVRSMEKWLVIYTPCCPD